MACSKYELGYDDKVMACSKYELGYDDDRFAIVVSQRFHCPICLLVLKDPVMCKNEHYYCSSCIKKYLENSANCPSCLEYLSVETLKPAPRIVMNYISELNIRCDFHSRGCPEMVQVGELKRHVESCGFSPVQCSNDGCNVVVNARDRLHHEAEVCGFRKLKCHDCGQLKNEMREIKDKMLLAQNVMKIEMKGMKDEMKGMKDEMKGIKDDMSACNNQSRNEVKGIVENKIEAMKEEVKREIKGEVNKIKEEIKKEMKEMKVEMQNEVKETVMTAIRDAMAGMKDLTVEMQDPGKSLQGACSSDARENILLGREGEMNKIKKMKDLKVEMQDPGESLKGACSSDARESIFLVGGQHRDETGIWIKNKSGECFNWADQTWRLLNFAKFEGRTSACSFLYRGQMFVAGGTDDSGHQTNTVTCLNFEDPEATWKDFAVNLPVKCRGHKVVNNDDCLYMSGGKTEQMKSIGRKHRKLEKRSNHFDIVYEVQLVRPYSSKILTRLPQPRSYHGMEMFDQKLFILGGYDGRMITASVIQYDLIKNECKEMPRLPYPVQNMVTVLWRNHVLVIGGEDASYQKLNKVIMYDVITGRSEMLPNMRMVRCGCSAVLTDKVVVVMGGRNAEGKDLKSVECFDLERRVWEDLPDMIEPRAYATAVVKPNH
ncbi:uncharacterized protein LOC114524115 [Dendronephthya gigantea]|uniref:uncharacterized protein LOC114524115 n=1 Tax=Dendronephthya gigantea TaxID=151771 RepID=UPI00106D7943|nr:uncharacterized protein LOC114524115 [Dendronephthya gigantea]